MVFLSLPPTLAPFYKGLETFRAREAIFSESVEKK